MAGEGWWKSAWSGRTALGEEIAGPLKITVADEGDASSGPVALTGVVRIQLGCGGASPVASRSDGDLTVAAVGLEHDPLEAVVLDDSDAAGAHLLGGVFDQFQEEPLHGVDPLVQRLAVPAVDGRWARVFRNVFHVVTSRLGVGRAPGS